MHRWKGKEREEEGEHLLDEIMTKDEGYGAIEQDAEEMLRVNLGRLDELYDLLWPEQVELPDLDERPSLGDGTSTSSFTLPIKRSKFPHLRQPYILTIQGHTGSGDMDEVHFETMTGQYLTVRYYRDGGVRESDVEKHARQVAQNDQNFQGLKCRVVFKQKSRPVHTSTTSQSAISPINMGYEHVFFHSYRNQTNARIGMRRYTKDVMLAANAGLLGGLYPYLLAAVRHEPLGAGFQVALDQLRISFLAAASSTAMTFALKGFVYSVLRCSGGWKGKHVHFNSYRTLPNDIINVPHTVLFETYDLIANFISLGFMNFLYSWFFITQETSWKNALSSSALSSLFVSFLMVFIFGAIDLSYTALKILAIQGTQKFDQRFITLVRAEYFDNRKRVFHTGLRGLGSFVEVFCVLMVRCCLFVNDSVFYVTGVEPQSELIGAASLNVVLASAAGLLGSGISGFLRDINRPPRGDFTRVQLLLRESFVAEETNRVASSSALPFVMYRWLLSKRTSADAKIDLCTYVLPKDAKIPYFLENHTQIFQLKAEMQNPSATICFVGCTEGSRVMKPLGVAMQEQKPLFNILNGDIFYTSGVDHPESSRFKEFYEMFYPHYPSDHEDHAAPVFATLGNHDYNCWSWGGKGYQQGLSRAVSLVEHTYINLGERSSLGIPKWNMPNRYYIIHIPDLLTLFFIDSTTFLFDTVQQNWLLTQYNNLVQFNNAGADHWVGLVSHHGVLPHNDFKVFGKRAPKENGTDDLKNYFPGGNVQLDQLPDACRKENRYYDKGTLNRFIARWLSHEELFFHFSLGAHDHLHMLRTCGYFEDKDSPSYLGLWKTTFTRTIPSLNGPRVSVTGAPKKELRNTPLLVVAGAGGRELDVNYIEHDILIKYQFNEAAFLYRNPDHPKLSYAYGSMTVTKQEIKFETRIPWSTSNNDNIIRDMGACLTRLTEK